MNLNREYGPVITGSHQNIYATSSNWRAEIFLHVENEQINRDQNPSEKETKNQVSGAAWKFDQKIFSSMNKSELSPWIHMISHVRSFVGIFCLFTQSLHNFTGFPT